MQKNELDNFLSPYTDINSKLSKDLNVKLKLLKEKAGSTLQEISRSNDFLNRTPIPRTVISIIHKWDLDKINRQGIMMTLEENAETGESPSRTVGPDFAPEKGREFRQT